MGNMLGAMAALNSHDKCVGQMHSLCVCACVPAKEQGWGGIESAFAQL